jgi:hypothetical protein
MAKREAPGREACRGDEIDDGNAERYGTASRGARVVRGHDQRDRPQLREITRELRFGVGGVQRNVDRAARDTQEADGGIGAPRQRARHAIAATDAVVGEAVPDARKPGRQVGEAQRLATELEQRRNVGCRPGQRFERRPERRVRQIDDVSLVPRDADVRLKRTGAQPFPPCGVGRPGSNDRKPRRVAHLYGTAGKAPHAITTNYRHTLHSKRHPAT